MSDIEDQKKPKVPWWSPFKVLQWWIISGHLAFLAFSNALALDYVLAGEVYLAVILETAELAAYSWLGLGLVAESASTVATYRNSTR